MHARRELSDSHRQFGLPAGQASVRPFFVGLVGRRVPISLLMGLFVMASCLASLPVVGFSQSQTMLSASQGMPLAQVLSFHGLTMGEYYYLQATSLHAIDLVASDTQGLPQEEVVVSSTVAEAATARARTHFFLRLGADGAAGPFFELGPGISGFWAEPRLLGECFFTANAEFLISSVFAELMEELLGVSIGLPGELTLSPLGQAVGAGMQVRFFSEYTEQRGAHGFGIGVGATGFFTQSDLGAPLALLGHACLSASWPFVELNVYYRLPLWTSDPDLQGELKMGSWGISFGLRDPLSPLIELIGASSK